MGGILRIYSICIFIQCTFFIPNNSNSQEKIKELSIDQLDSKAWTLRKISPDSTLYFSDLIIKKLRSSGDTATIAKFYNYKGLGYYYKGDNYTSYRYYLKANNIAKQLGDTIQLAHSMNNLCRFFMSQGNYMNAYNYALDALNIFKGLDDIDGTAYSLKRISEVYLIQGYEEKGISSLKEALNIRLGQNNITLQSTAHIDLARAYLNLDSLNKAKFHFEIALEKAKAVDNTALQTSSKIGLSDYFINVEKFDSAVILAKDAILSTERLNNLDLYNQALIQIAKSYFYTEDFDRSESLFLKALENTLNSNDLFLQRDCYYYLAEIYGNLDMGNKAYKALLKYYGLTKQLENVKDKRSIDSLLFNDKLKVTAEENRILSLTEQKDKALIESQQNVNMLLLISILLVVLSLILIFFSLKKIKKNNRLLRTKNKSIHAKKEELSTLLEQKSVLESQIEEKLELYQLISENSSDLIILHKLDGRCQYISPSAERILGYKPEELINQDLIKLIHIQDKEKFKDIINDISSGELKVNNIEYRLKAKSGLYIWFEVNASPALNDEGDLISIQTSSRDISQRKKIQSAIEKNEANLKALIENTTDIIYSIDLDNRLLTFNQAFRKGFYVIFSEKLKLGLKLDQVYQHPGTKEMWLDNINRAKNGERRITTMTYIGRDNKPYYYENFYNPIMLEEDIIGVSVFGRDITDKLKEEEKIQRYQEGLRLINRLSASEDVNINELLNSSLEVVCDYLKLPLGIISRIKDDKYIVKQFFSKNDNELSIDQVFKFSDTYCDLTFKNKRVTSISDMSISGHRGHPCYAQFKLESYIGAIVYVDGRAYGTVNFSDTLPRKEEFDELDRDFMVLYSNWVGALIQRRQANQKLKREKDRAEKASEAKADFLSVMSHEIRTPLNGIIGLTNILIKENPRTDQVKNLELLKFSSDNLLVIINDILDFNKIEADKIILEEKNFNLFRLIESIQQTHDIKAKEKGILLDMEYDKNLPTHFIGDPVRLGQIINNLVSNALKFTHNGKVEILCQLVNKEEDLITFDLSVNDTGKGIEPDKIKMIFEMFSQEEDSTTRKYGGTGLGLPISQKLLKLMNSDIRVKSIPGKGSKFSFRLKLMSGENLSTKNNIIADNENGSLNLSKYDFKILVADDNEVNYKIVESYLQLYGLNCSHALDGQEVIKMFKKGGYDLILLDLQMPILDGYETATQIKKLDPKIPLIALTASVIDEVKKKAKRYGMMDFIGKPIEPDELYSKVLNALNISHNSKDKKYHLAEDYENKKEILQHLIKQQTMGDMNFYKELIDHYIKNIEELRTIAKSSYPNNDKDSILASVHKHKTLLEGLRLHDLSKNLNNLIIDIDNGQTIDMHINKFDTECQSSIKLLEEIK